MMVCFACHDGRISSLLETCTELRLYMQGIQGEFTLLCLPPPWDGLAGYPALLERLGARTLVCGALTRNWECFLRGNGLRLKPWASGQPEALLGGLAAHRPGPARPPRDRQPRPSRPRPASPRRAALA